MRDFSARNFGLTVAYLIPGFIAIFGVAALSPSVQAWLLGSPEPTIGGFLYLMLGSLAAGMTVNGLRWLIVDTILHRTGLIRPRWDDLWLAEKLPAVEFLVENYYRHYLFYANSLIAILFSYATWRCTALSQVPERYWFDLAAAVLAAVFFAASRDTLRKFYLRATLLLGNLESEAPMSNGGGQAHGKTKKTETSKVKPVKKPGTAVERKETPEKPKDRQA